MIRKREQGGVSIFIVIFTALLVTIVTASFAQLMIRNQQQASANDLSQSAYDSAMAGVEDAKRALVKLQDLDNKGDAYQHAADLLRAALKSQSCDSLGQGKADVVTFTNGEVTVGNAAQNQAYTCVKVDLDTPDYKDDGLAPGVPVVVPLRSESTFKKVHISWFSKADLDKATSYAADAQPSFPSTGGGSMLLPNNGEGLGDWPTNAPALLRAQLIQFNKDDGVDLIEFNKQGTPNARTLFLYPQDYTSTTTPQTLLFSADERRDSTTQNVPQRASCNRNFDDFNGYACSVELTLPEQSGGGTREAYLQLQAYYQQYTSFKVELLDSDGNNVDLHEVQPRVDSTGRASSLFRRIEANVSLRNDGVSLPYPDAALSVGGDLCKNFFVTNKAGDYNTNDASQACSN